VESSQQAKLQEENELHKQQLQLQGQKKEDRPHILGEQQKQEEPTTTKETPDEQQKRDGLQVEIETLNRQLQEKEFQAGQEIQSLKQQVKDKEAQLAYMASSAMEAL